MNNRKLPVLGGLFLSAIVVACSDGGQSASTSGTTTESMPEADPAPAVMAASVAVGDVVETQWGSVRGETLTDDVVGVSATIFRGIPYAAPPVGNLRWRPPQPAQPWQAKGSCW
ncbi:carboxylesterase family protein [Pseudohongiella nitratireducens]|uniref:carboxylesterase family protein n=1 Tax=Pseudohongiella nitratireducens TaxID=1768907 RepID=UPI0030EC5828